MNEPATWLAESPPEMPVEAFDARRRTADARRRRTRLSIVEGAYRALAQVGCQAATIDDIIRHAGVSRATFYLYFENKPAVVDVIIDRSAAVVERIFADLPPLAQANRKQLDACFRKLCDFFAANPDLAEVWHYAISDIGLAHHMADAASRTAARLRIPSPDEAQGAGRAAVISALFFNHATQSAFMCARMPRASRDMMISVVAEGIERSFVAMLRAEAAGQAREA